MPRPLARPSRRSPAPALLLTLAALAAAPAVGVAAEPDPLVYSRKGTLPILLTAPHGGTKQPPGVELRTGGGSKDFKVVLDTRTKELALEIAAALEKELGGKPYIVAAEFSRKYIDANRSAADGLESPAAKPVYDHYHSTIRGFVDEIRAKFKRGILIDVHGQGVNVDHCMRGTRDGATCKALIDKFGDKILVGPDGLFGLLEKNGIQVIPANKSPLIHEDKFNGGYTVATYGSSNPTGLDAFQMEFGTNYRSPANLKNTAAATAKSIATFYKTYVTK